MLRASNTSHTDTMLNEIQKKLYGQRKEKLSAVEIHRLFQTPITPEFNLLIYRALQRQAINPDVTILQVIPRAVSKEYLITIAMCLRFGADSNMYVEAPRLGTIHILGYVYSMLGNGQIVDESVLNTIVLMLLLSSSRPSMPIFDSKGGRIREPGDTQPISSLTVTEWLNEQGYNTLLNDLPAWNADELKQVVDKESMVILSILLDNPALMTREYLPQDMSLAIRSFSPIDKIPVSDDKILMDYTSMSEAVTHLNADAYDKLLKKGLDPSYLLINKILISLRTYHTEGNISASQELQRMLISSVSLGIQLDQDQMNIVSTLGRDILEAVMKEYEQPYWRKICRATDSKQQLPDQLRRLAISLNIDPNSSRTAVCENISNLAKSDKEALKEAARRRQQLRMASDLGTMNEFLGNKTPTLVCRNKSLLPHDPLDYNDVDLAYYRDDQGAVWCFGSDSFSSLLESGVNPYNSTILPESFKVELRYRIDLLNQLGIDSTRVYRAPMTFSQSIESLTAKDIVNEKGSVEITNTFIQIAAQNNISAETIKSLTKDQMIAAFRSIGYEVNLSPLSTSHALIATAHIVVYLQRNDPTAVAPFFDSII